MKIIAFVTRLALLIAFVFLAALSFKQTELQGQEACKPLFRAGRDAVCKAETGRARVDGHCETNCAQSLNISGPDPISANVDQTISVTFFTNRALGGPNTLCTSTGAVNWGDGPTNEDMPTGHTQDCGSDQPKIAGMNPPSVTMTHKYSKPGRYCLSAIMSGSHKYEGDGTCSYDCTLRADKIVTVR